jgi:hypothetical protein
MVALNMVAKMAYCTISQIQYQGKTYIDLSALAEAVQEIYPIKTHTIRRWAKLGKIPYKRSGFNQKLWFNIEEANKALIKLFGDRSKFLADIDDEENYLDGL